MLCDAIGSCGSAPADWTSAQPPPVVNSSNYTPPSTTQPDTDTEHAYSDHADYIRSRDYSDDLAYDARDVQYVDDLDASAYGVTSSSKPEMTSSTIPEVYRVTSSTKPEVQ